MSDVKATNKSPVIQKNVSVDDMHKRILSTAEILYPSMNPEWQVVKPRHFDEYIATPPHWQSILAALQDEWGWHFKNVVHLQCALTHFSVIESHRIDSFPANRTANRSLEWLGDSVLQVCVSSYLFQTYPTTQEGQLSQLRSALVKNPVLDVVAVQLKIPSAIVVGSSVRHHDHVNSPQALKLRQTVHASAVEALIGAVLLDQGMTKAIEFVNTRILPLAIEYSINRAYWDPISDLQRELQARGHSICYKDVQNEDQTLQSTLVVNDKEIMTVQDGSFKAARKKIATALLVELRKEPNMFDQ
ncbi:ribonuclease 3 [Thraustotheca clavata]|uniref:Ribonuclease 3 n=1 Tax=Thraustotheca clavata TaxID=74557 RepID=A0A1W0ACI0_9STRA|nr:ribonuclease 3 [Thraustotheca clavata]